MYVLRQCQKAFESLSSEWCFFAGAAAGVLLPPAALLAGIILPLNRAFWVAAGTLAVLLLQWGNVLFSDPHFETYLDHRPAYAEYEIKLTDSRLSTLPHLDRRRGVVAELRKLRLSGENEFRLCSGKVTFYSNLPPPQIHGTVLTGRRTLEPFDRSIKDRHWILVSDRGNVKGVERSWQTWLLEVRDKLLSRLCSHISDDTNRNLACAFFFGFTGGLNTERRQDFAAAGTVHLFAVSGLHVGMVALLVLWGLRCLPFRMRCFGAALMIGFYVLLTGAAVPAVRAGVMIGMVLVCRGMLLAVSSLRLLGAAAAVIVIADPDALNAVGAHYSFFITASLLLLGKKLKEYYDLEGKIYSLMPFTAQTVKARRRYERRFKLFSLVISGIVAAAAGTVIAYGHSIAVAPGAVAANVLTIPVLGMLFAWLPVKLICSYLPENIDRFAAQVIEYGFDYLRFVAETTADLAAPFYAAEPGIWVVGSMIVLFLAALGMKKKSWSVAAGGAFIFLLLFFPVRSFWERPKVTVISSDTLAPPTIVVTDTALKEAVVVNPVNVHAEDMDKVLRTGAVTDVAEVRFSQPSVRNLSGMEYLNSRYRIQRVIMPGNNKRNRQFFDSVTERKGEFFYAPEGAGWEKLHLFREKNKFAIEYPESGVMLGWRLELNDRDNGREIILIRNGKRISTTLPWSNKNGVWQYEL